MASTAPADAISASSRRGFERFCAESPAWMIKTYHVFRMVQLLDDFAKIPTSVASEQWDAAWVVIRNVPESIDALFRWELFLDQKDERQRYNARTLELVRKKRKPVLASFRGYRDLFVPIISKGRCESVLVAGPFFLRPPSAKDIWRQWVELRGSAADPFDPGLAAYAHAILDVQVLPPRELAAFTELMEILARGLADDARQPDDLRRVADLRQRVFARMPRSKQWKAAMMLDPLTGRRWTQGTFQPWTRTELGVEHLPNTVIAVMPAQDPGERDIVSSLVAARAFQHRCAEISARLPDTLSAPLESYGSYILWHSPARRNAALRRLSVIDRARQIAEMMRRDLGVRVAVGVGALTSADGTLPESGRQAAIALQLAVHQEAPLVAYDDMPGEWRGSTVAETPAGHVARLVELFATGMFSELAARQADYVRAVLWESGGLTGAVRTHFEYAIDSLLGALRSHRGIDESALSDLRQRLRVAFAQATSSHALVAAQGDALKALVHVACEPGQSQLKLKLARAARYIEEHCADRLTLGRVARQVGLSRNYFCSSFAAASRSGFADYLRNARVERAKHLLRYSTSPISQTGQEAGFVSVPHFNRAFKSAVGVTPSRYRAGFKTQEPEGQSAGSTKATALRR
jgi:AraC-like DNA-binding protein